MARVWSSNKGQWPAMHSAVTGGGGEGGGGEGSGGLGGGGEGGGEGGGGTGGAGGGAGSCGILWSENGSGQIAVAADVGIVCPLITFGMK